MAAPIVANTQGLPRGARRRQAAAVNEQRLSALKSRVFELESDLLISKGTHSDPEISTRLKAIVPIIAEELRAAQAG